MISAAADSVANTCIFPLQDILHLGCEARMNTPAAAGGNWSWRFSQDALHPDFATQLAAIIEITDRDLVSAETQTSSYSPKSDFSHCHPSGIDRNAAIRSL